MLILNQLLTEALPWDPVESFGWIGQNPVREAMTLHKLY